MRIHTFCHICSVTKGHDRFKPASLSQRRLPEMTPPTVPQTPFRLRLSARVSARFRAESDHLERIQFFSWNSRPASGLESRPESGLGCLACAIFRNSITDEGHRASAERKSEERERKSEHERVRGERERERERARRESSRERERKSESERARRESARMCV